MDRIEIIAHTTCDLDALLTLHATLTEIVTGDLVFSIGDKGAVVVEVNDDDLVTVMAEFADSPAIGQFTFYAATDSPLVAA